MTQLNLQSLSGSLPSFRLETRDRFDFLSASYRRLFEQSYATVFQSPLWLSYFYGELVPALGADPMIVAVYLDSSPDPVLVLPFVRQRYYGFNIMQPADLGVADYNAVVGSPEVLSGLAKVPGFKRQLAKALNPFDILLFRKERPEAFSIGNLFESIRETPSASSAYEVELDTDYDSWFQATMSKNSRKGLTRKRRGFCQEYGDLIFREASDPSDIRRAFDFMREQRILRYKDDLFSRPAYFEFYLKVALTGAETGFASTFVGETTDELITVDFGLVHADRHLFLMGAFSGAEAHRKYSLGLLAVSEVIKEGRAKGLSTFDLTIGDEPYKQSFGARQVALTNVSVVSGLRGRAAFTAYQSAGPLRKMLKTLMPDFN